MMEAGLPEYVCPDSGEWLFIDIGFSKKRKSCGFLGHDDVARVFTFAEASARVIAAAALTKAADDKSTLNLLIEAPLSVAFDNKGNPTGRVFERRLNEPPRYWYLNGGCVVMTSAMYLLRAVHDSKPKRRIRLFEGFLSFKSKATLHCEDVEALRAVVFNPKRAPGLVLAPNQLASRSSETVVSAFVVAGMDLGVHPVVRTST